MSARRPRSAPGPVPTLAQLARHTNWVRALCTAQCAHDAAIPLAPIIARFGAEASSDRLRNALRCTACGKRGGRIMLPSWHDMQVGVTAMPVELVPLALRREIAEDALRSIGVQIQR